MINFLTPITEGYFWYEEVDEVDGRNRPIKFGRPEIVRTELYSNGNYKNSTRLKKPRLMMSIIGRIGLEEVRKTKGIWGRKISGLKTKEYES